MYWAFFKAVVKMTSIHIFNSPISIVIIERQIFKFDPTQLRIVIKILEKLQRKETHTLLMGM